MEENFIVNLANRKIDQISYLYKDIETQARVIETIYNTPKFKFTETIGGTIEYRGTKTKVSVKWGAVKFFNTQIEYIQWLKGECIYKEFLDQGREGFHHIGIHVPDIQPYIYYFKKNGIGILQSERISNLRFVYFDTEKTFGILIRLFDFIKYGRKKSN
ncbi:MAG: VOC family protein [Candidatus Lokiarchaeia archaeon]|nr:VOC family protein [Candidatus Lokiarchaeia archaeon]